MTRVKRGIVVKKRHRRILKLTKGNWGQRKNIFKRAKETLMRSWAFAFKSRRLRKRDMRSLFITRINAAVQNHGIRYNAFIHGLKKAHIVLNRKMLSQLAICEPAIFGQIVSFAKK
ncbi:MAG TPA: 50S ribosomal protein L20 [Candidatus Babeliales bacterium]|jgi:large subunit ribosomal protein L20|nr:50S ribosomal protein L20 [Candidatus Babeliales bacterium]